MGGADPFRLAEISTGFGVPGIDIHRLKNRVPIWDADVENDWV
jgi:hypothetical protein